MLETFQTWTMRTIILQQVKRCGRWGAVVSSAVRALYLNASCLFLSSKVYVAGSPVDSPQLPVEMWPPFLVTLMAFPLLFSLPHQVSRKLSSHQASSAPSYLIRLPSQVLGWPKSLFGFSHKMLQKTQMSFLTNPVF